MRSPCLLLLVLLACADSESIDQGGPSSTTTGGAGGEGGEGGEGGAAVSSASATTTSSSSAGGAEPSPCGNGQLDAGEECDDANDAPGDGCHACVVECGGPGESKHPQTFHCFRYVASPLGWTEAQAACSAWGTTTAPADLASIRSDQELANVLTVAASEAWIGLNDRASEGDYVWSDGEPFDYDAWATFQPSDRGDDALDCVVFRTTGLWADESCATPRPYVCERRPAGAP